MRIIFYVFILLTANGIAQENKIIEQLKINQIQTIGSHNSYHIRANKFVLRFLKGLAAILPKEYNPKDLDYAHEPLFTQLDSFHLRSFEIDVYADPNGGHFYKRKKNNLLGKPKISKITALKEPGFKVMHIPDIDYNTHYFTFKSMLSDFKKWSDSHPNHLPIYIMIECKEETIADKIKPFHFTKAIQFTPALCDDLDNEVKEIFGESLQKVITPDEVRDTFATLRDAVLAGNFPTLNNARGKFIFIVMQQRDTYTKNHFSLKDRAMFVFSDANAAEAAFIKYDDALHDENEIKKAVQKGFIVRTRADGPNIQNRSGDYSQQDAAFRSGAQIISTDYYRPDIRHQKKPRKFTNYATRFIGNDIARINPINSTNYTIEEK